MTGKHQGADDAVGDGEAIGARLGIGPTAEVYAWGDDRIVKVLRPGFPDGLGEAEATAAALVGLAVEAAPRFFGTARVGGRYVLVHQRLAGPSMLERLSARPRTVGRLARQFGALHASMHGSNGAGLPDQKAYYRRMIERAGAHLPPAARAASLERLGALPDGTAICHGDMHPGNVLMAATGPVIIDWLTAGVGPPAADVARTQFPVRLRHDPRGAPGRPAPGHRPAASKVRGEPPRGVPPAQGAPRPTAGAVAAPAPGGPPGRGDRGGARSARLPHPA